MILRRPTREVELPRSKLWRDSPHRLWNMAHATYRCRGTLGLWLLHEDQAQPRRAPGVTELSCAMFQQCNDIRRTLSRHGRHPYDVLRMTVSEFIIAPNLWNVSDLQQVSS